MESSRPKEKRKTKEHITPGNGDRYEKNEQELDGTRKEGPGLNSYLPLKTYRFSKPYELYIPAKHRNKLRRLQKRYFESNDLKAVGQVTIIFNQIKEKHRLKAINEELLALNINSKVQNLTLLFNKRSKATRNVDIPCIQYNSTFIYDSKTMADLFSSIFANHVEIISGSASRVILWNNRSRSICRIKSLPLFVHYIDAYCSSENALNVVASVSVSHSTSDNMGTLNV
ncbi:unnamed protein product [Schistosoma curassoni]|uniref:Alba domain-containing protein n=1 Tax=Schistosoma curassoni TaxID=6186 RepID=A0A183K3G9_9TREM|nr:unnamed protein product [Schistosoma curassoni]